MALDPITSGSDPAQVYDRINQIITSLNAALAELVNLDPLDSVVAALSGTVSHLIGDLNNESRYRTFNDDLEIEARQAAVSALTRLMDEAETLNASRLLKAIVARVQFDRPASIPEAFTTSPTGSATADGNLDPSSVVAGVLGKAYRMAASGRLAPRVAIPLDQDRIWVLSARYWRIEDDPDPNNSAFDVGIQWLDASDEGCGVSLVRRESALRVQDGLRSVTARVPTITGQLPLVVPPIGAVSWRPYVKTYGGGAVGISVLGAYDATYASVYSPDLERVLDRLRNIEGVLLAGLPISTQAPASYMVADLPPVLPLSPGRRAWASDGRARQADGSLEPANGGTGVSVEDNGTRWVISGTNQQVQA